MPPDMFYNCNEEIKRQKEQTIWSRNRQICRDRGRIRDGDRYINRTFNSGIEGSENVIFAVDTRSSIVRKLFVYALLAHGRNLMKFKVAVAVLALAAMAGCEGLDGEQGIAGEAGKSCTVIDNQDGTKTLSCEDGTSVTIYDGAQGLIGPTGPRGEGQPGKDGVDGGER